MFYPDIGFKYPGERTLGDSTNTLLRCLLEKELSTLSEVILPELL